MPFASLFLAVLGFAFYAKSASLFTGSNGDLIAGIIALAGLGLYVAFFAIGLVRALPFDFMFGFRFCN